MTDFVQVTNFGRVYNLLSSGGVETYVDVSDVGGIGRTNEVDMVDRHTFGWCIKCSSDGGVNVKVEIEEKIGDSFVVPENKKDYPMMTITDELEHIASGYSPVAAPKVRLKFTGLTGNDATVKVVVVKLSMVRSS